jgi:hypothetical protein
MKGPEGASTTWEHHLPDPYGGYSMVWMQLVWFAATAIWISFGSDLLAECRVPNFPQPTAVEK